MGLYGIFNFYDGIFYQNTMIPSFSNYQVMVSVVSFKLQLTPSYLHLILIPIIA